MLPTRKTAADLVAGGATQPTAHTFEAAPARLALKTTSGVAITDAALTQARVVTADVRVGAVVAAGIPFGVPVPTLASPQTITINASPLTITDTTSTPAPTLATDVRASNGVIHVISKVLIP